MFWAPPRRFRGTPKCWRYFCSRPGVTRWLPGGAEGICWGKMTFGLYLPGTLAVIRISAWVGWIRAKMTGMSCSVLDILDQHKTVNWSLETINITTSLSKVLSSNGGFSDLGCLNLNRQSLVFRSTKTAVGWIKCTAPSQFQTGSHNWDHHSLKNLKELRDPGKISADKITHN